ncbi:cation efflux system protein [Azorhizobium oxalatiphilum]|uniref:Cation efflux system protein n=1 Tax=Azorhizobium oxalatiphilum TaxID=980631 RepID=A0A917C2E3_9HYPH|nr:efflux RND transporter periplasmic adaptor subunit [Azorhizobium oxalatiphilum]GGF68640.1 cation efflux system protein [Azorhizobium oxalatiphilum]
MSRPARDIALLLLGLAMGSGAVYALQSRTAPAATQAGGHAEGGEAGHSEEGHGGHGEEDHAEGGTSVSLPDAKLASSGIGLETAGPGALRVELRLNGLIQANQEAIVQVTPRFPGVVRDIRRSIGDQVNKDDALARIESNQSLTTYELKAPISGTIVSRQVGLGEYVSEQKPAFVVADLSTVWVDLSVYRRDFARIKVGSPVHIDPEDGGAPIAGRVAYVSPIGATDTQSALARVVVANPDLRLRPGLFAVGHAVLAEEPVDLAVRDSAIQTIDGRNVVFVRDGDTFDARDVEIGRRDGQWVEILFGLMPGDVYAAKNSFVVKAELAKGSATHEH